MVLRRARRRGAGCSLRDRLMTGARTVAERTRAIDDHPEVGRCCSSRICSSSSTTNPWRRKGVSTQGRSRSVMVMPTRRSVGPLPIGAILQGEPRGLYPQSGPRIARPGPQITERSRSPRIAAASSLSTSESTGRCARPGTGGAERRDDDTALPRETHRAATSRTARPQGERASCQSARQHARIGEDLPRGYRMGPQGTRPRRLQAPSASPAARARHACAASAGHQRVAVLHALRVGRAQRGSAGRARARPMHLAEPRELRICCRPRRSGSRPRISEHSGTGHDRPVRACPAAPGSRRTRGSSCSC